MLAIISALIVATFAGGALAAKPRYGDVYHFHGLTALQVTAA